MVKLDWEKVSVDEIVCSFIKAELDKFSLSNNDIELILNPNFNDNEENQRRHDILLSRRGPLWQKIPDDTEWWHVGPVNLRFIKRFHIIDKCGWNHLFEPDSSLESVVKNIHRDLQKHDTIYSIANSLLSKPQIMNNSTIIFGHSKDGPFTILEGNNRWCALMLHNNKGAILKGKIYLYAGISKNACHWYFGDD